MLNEVIHQDVLQWSAAVQQLLVLLGRFTAGRRGEKGFRWDTELEWFLQEQHEACHVRDRRIEGAESILLAA